MIIVGSLVSILVTRAREHAETAQNREQETGTLYALSQDLARAVDADSIITAVAKHVREIFTWESVFLLPDEKGLVIRFACPDLKINADDIAVATWAFQHGAIAGYDTDTLHGSPLRYIPLQSSQKVLGIIGVKPSEPDGIITHEQERVLTAFANQAALALERVNLTNKAGK
jgi:two-component system sensor histidine kinase KdpD